MSGSIPLSDNDSIPTPDALRERVRGALGLPARPWGTPSKPRKIGERELPGYRLVEYEYTNGHGERVPLSVAEPTQRLHGAPMIAIHQTNETGRREVFGLDGDPTLAYGHELARRGHRVFAIDLAWTGERAPGIQWDKDGFYKEHPDWSMIGKAVADLHDLSVVIHGSFEEQDRPRCIGHSLGGLIALFYLALYHGLSRAVCNASYFQTPAVGDPWQSQLYTSRVLSASRREFCIASYFDTVVSLAGMSAPLLLIHYCSDAIIEHPTPTMESQARMKAYGDGVRVVGLDGSHGFPIAAKYQSYDFMKIDDLHTWTFKEPITPLYYQQSELWGNPPDPYQMQVRADVLSLLPKNVRSVLDIGCGDGFVTNELPEQLSIIGVDISTEALKYVKWPTLVSSATHLPFADGQFDLVMANDVLEHFNESTRAAAIKEIRRVSNRYVLLTCPHNEQLEANMACCADCGSPYHVHWHQHSFRAEGMLGLFEPSFKALEVRYSGDVTLPPNDPCIRLQHELGLYRTWRGAVCPTCGSANQVRSATDSPLIRLMAVHRCATWYDNPTETARLINRSEIMVLYGTPGSPASIEPATLPEQRDDLLAVDFSNPLQYVSDFGVGARWATYMIPPGTWRTESGIRCEWNVSSPLVIELRMPVVPKVGDRIIAELSSHRAEGRFSIYTIDGILGQRGLLANESVNGLQQTLEWPITQPWWPDRYGAGLAIWLGPDVEIHRLRYVRQATGPQKVPFVSLTVGHNLIRTVRDGVAYSWGMTVDTSGRVPAPYLDERQQPAARSDTNQTTTDLLRLAGEAQRHFEMERLNLTGMLEGKEKARDEAERAYAHAERGLAKRARRAQQWRERAGHRRQQSRGYRMRWEGAAAELQSIQGIRGSARHFARSLKHKLVGHPSGNPHQVMTSPWKKLTRPTPPAGATLRVLVLSHMFPHPDQPSSGPFIHEQVKALRRFADVDARVVVGRPYWMTHRNPLKLWQSNRNFWRFHEHCMQWWEYDGVPVAYLPYRIFGPWFTQGWSYQSSVVAALEWIRRDFNFDLVHAHTGFLDGAAGVGAAKAAGVPLVITEHTGPFSLLMHNPIVKRSTLRALRTARRVIVVSRAQGREVSSHLGRADSNEVMVVPNVVDTELFRPPESWKADAATPRIVFVGYFVPIKQLPLLLEAFGIVRRTVPGATLRLVGGGENRGQESALTSDIQRRGLEGSVIVQGHQRREQVARIMRDECDVLVLCSQSETFGCVLTEAMASGKPIVATRCGGPEDIVLDDRVGRLCENGSATALAEAILHVVRELGQFKPHAIHDIAETHFGEQSVVKRLSDVYRSVTR
ncbi:MAG: glycosyltransferase [Planctomycetota bacterium]|mgnify:CR=1 FL=1